VSGDAAGPGATSDVLRPRRTWLAAGAAAFAVALVVTLIPASWRSAPGPLSAQHTQAGVKCTSCHGEQVGARVSTAACVACHGDHPSTRGAHQARRQDLTCASCHAAHAGPGSAIVAGGAVARVPMSACARCHDPGKASDPARACVGTGEWAGLSVCFDEHQRPGAPLPARGACSREHGQARFVAWEEARQPHAPGPAVRAPRGWSMQTAWIGLGSGGAAATLAFLGGAFVRRTRRRSSLGVPAPAPHERVRLPRIDATTCLGCQACVDACPFDALAVDHHVAVLARPDACCGAAACERACPNGSLRIVERDEPVADRPRVDAQLESLDRPGLFVAGDLTGIPLIRSAIAQGVAVADHVAATLSRAAGERDTKRVDLVVVGSGPAGLSAALRARERGLSCVVLEQSDLAASIRAFPRGKIVQDAPIELPVEGPLWFRESTREELVAHWTRIVRTHRVDVRVGHRVTGVDAEPGGFRVSAQTPEGVRAVHASRVLLATGRRGTPRALDAEVAPEARGMVLPALSDARAWAGKRVLVVGLGDSAMEAIVALARQPGTVITVSYRGAGFARGSAKNIDAVRRLAEAGRIRVLLGTCVTRVTVPEITLQGSSGTERVAADAVLALVGGEPSRALLAAAGVLLSGKAGA
jgi:thioredoxin reductase/NAD-dependent dihydropyrimidine dehydrogenase PreA subunit